MVDPENANVELRQRFAESDVFEEESGAKALLRKLMKKLPLIIFLLVILGALAWFFVLKPQPGNLAVEIVEMDSGDPLVSATVSLTTPDGRSVADDRITDESGIAVFRGIPTEEDLTARVMPASSGQNTVSKSVTVESGGSQNLRIEVDRKTKLKIESNDIELRLAPGCSKKVRIDVSNAGGTTDEEATLIASKNIRDNVVFESPTIVVPSDSSASVYAVVGTPEKSTNGELRIKYTKRKVDLNIEVVKKGPNLKIDFESRGMDYFKVDADELPLTKKSQVAMRNSASAGALYVTDISVRLEGEVAGWITLDLNPVAAANAAGGIEPKEEVYFTYEITVPEGTEPGPYTGRLITESSCETLTVPISIEVREP